MALQEFQTILQKLYTDKYFRDLSKHHCYQLPDKFELNEKERLALSQLNQNKLEDFCTSLEFKAREIILSMLPGLVPILEHKDKLFSNFYNNYSHCINGSYLEYCLKFLHFLYLKTSRENFLIKGIIEFYIELYQTKIKSKYFIKCETSLPKDYEKFYFRINPLFSLKKFNYDFLSIILNVKHNRNLPKILESYAKEKIYIFYPYEQDFIEEVSPILGVFFSFAIGSLRLNEIFQELENSKHFSDLYNILKKYLIPKYIKNNLLIVSKEKILNKKIIGENFL